MPKVIAALGGLKPWEASADRVPQHFARSAAGLPEDGFQFRKGVLDRIEIGTVFREKPETRADPFNRAADSRTLVTRQVVHDDDVAGCERRGQDLLDVSEEAGAVDRAIKHGRRGEARDAERREKRRGVPAAIWRMVGHAGAVEAAPISPHEVGPHATFIKKYEARRIELGRRGVPRGPGERDVSAVVFGRAYRFF